MLASIRNLVGIFPTVLTSLQAELFSPGEEEEIRNGFLNFTLRINARVLRELDVATERTRYVC